MSHWCETDLTSLFCTFKCPTRLAKDSTSGKFPPCSLSEAPHSCKETLAQAIMPWLHQGCLFKAGNLCWERNTSYLTLATADLLLVAPQLPQTTLTEEGAHQQNQEGRCSLLCFCWRWGACGHRLAPSPGAGMRRAACILRPWGKRPPASSSPCRGPGGSSAAESAHVTGSSSSDQIQLCSKTSTISSVAGCWSLPPLHPVPSAGCAS